MKLFQKALVLLTIPLLFEIVLILVLLVQNDAIEKEAQRLVKSKAMVQSIFMTHLAYMDAVRSIYKLHETGKLSYLREHKEIMDEMPHLISQVHKTTRANRMEHDPSVEQLLSISERVKSSIRRGAELAEIGKPISHEDLVALVAACDDATPLLSDCSKLSRKLVLRQWQQDKESETRQATMRTAVETTLFTGLALNFALAIAMAAWLNRETISRLNLIMTNAQRIGLELPLEVRVPGRDEISELDLVLHKVSQVLFEMRQQEREMQTMKEEFYAMVAHDLRSPLTSVGVAMQLVLAGAKGEVPVAVSESLTLASVEMDKAYHLINEFLDLRKFDARGFQLKMQKLSADSLLTECIDGVIPQARVKRITITVESTPLQAFADEGNLSRVVTSFLAHAIIVSADESEIVVRLASDEEPDMVRFEFADFGPSVPDSEKDLVFAGFSLPGHEGKSDDGLGLAIAKLIVEQHGGAIGVRDNSPSGSVFWFTVPTCERVERSTGD